MNTNKNICDENILKIWFSPFLGTNKNSDYQFHNIEYQAYMDANTRAPRKLYRPFPRKIDLFNF